MFIFHIENSVRIKICKFTETNKGNMFLLNRYITRLTGYFCTISLFLLSLPGEGFSTGNNAILPDPIVDSKVERIMWQVDPLGLLEYGPAVSIELRIFQSIFITTHFRYYYGGLLYHARSTDFWKSSDIRIIPASMGIIGKMNRDNPGTAR